MMRRATTAATSLFLFAAVAGVIVGTSHSNAADSIVHTRDNGAFQGEVTESGTNVIIRSHGGVETVIPKTDVASIEPVGNYADEFKSRLAKLDAKDVAGRIALARDAFEHREYDLARTTLDLALSIDPNNREASDLQNLIQNQMRLERARENPTTAPTALPPRPALAGQGGVDRRLLTTADIEAIRRAELQPGDVNVRIRFDSNDVKKRFADSQNVGYAEFAALLPVEQALLIFDRGDESMRDKVHILSDPGSIIEYRRQIQPLVLQNCATTGCHGGPSGAGLVLFTNADNDAVTYTNFYILQSYRKRLDAGNTGIFSGNLKRLIMRGHGEQSLLANYGLPTNVAEYDHPLVNGKPIQPIFRNKQDARYLMVVDWMNNALNNVEPDYGIRYTPPSALPPNPGAATQPAAPANP
jgi:hypothetical protein